MGDGIFDLTVNIAAGLLTAILLWLLQRSLRRRRAQRTRDFFGLQPGAKCLLVVNRHTSSSSEMSVHRRDVFALLELAGLIRQCGSRVDVASHDEVRRGFGEKAEFCIGGPASNSRTAAHLAWKLPGVEIVATNGKRSTIRVGADEYSREDNVEYVLLAKIVGPEQQKPVFLICGQSAVANQAAVRYLVAHERNLARKYGLRTGFSAMLRVVNPEAYGPDVVEWVADVTNAAQASPEPPARPTGPERAAPQPNRVEPAQAKHAERRSSSAKASTAKTQAAGPGADEPSS
jgi:hypothetical protein